MEDQNLEAEKSTEVADPSMEENNENGKIENDAEFTDTASEQSETEAQKPTETDAEKKQGKSNDDVEAARRRREQELNERIKKAVEKAVAEDRKKRNSDAELEFAKKYVKVNKFTNAAINDAEDLDVYNTQLEMEKEGLDPVKDYAKYVADKRRQERQSKEVTDKSEEAYFKKDTEMLVTVYGKDEAAKILADKEFMDYFDKVTVKKGTRLSVLAVRTMWERENANATASKTAKETAARILANESAGTGSIDSKGGSNEEFYTLEQLKTMSQNEIDKNWTKVQKSYERLNKK